MKKENKNKGFTLIELLAVITILGILMVISIVAVTRLINKSKREQKNAQEQTVIMAAESYLQANRALLPKSIGETTTIFVSNLKDSNYLKDDVFDASGQSCMTKSYVVAYKKSVDKYEYKAHLICGNDKTTDKDNLPEPTVDIKFYALDENGVEVDASSTTDFLSKVANPKYKITITGGTSEGKDYDLEGYNYSISVSLRDANNPNSTANREVYSSGSLSANRSKKVIIPGDTSAGNVSGDLKDYIDITQATDVAIHVVARNTEGVAYQKTTYLSGKTESSGSTTYKDREKPICTSIKGQAKNENDWINKSNYSSNPRKITVTCSDKGGSGCVRNKYTKTWPNTKEESAEFSYIEVADNAGNKSGKVNSCKVRVNVDIKPPVVSVNAYRRANNNTPTGDSVLNNAPIKSEGASDDKVTIKADAYKSLNGGWMNNSEYPNGVIYKVVVTDNLYLKEYSWKVNKPGITKTSDSDYSNYSTNSEHDGIDTVSITGDSGTCNTSSCTLYVSFTKEGRRKGVLTLVDRAGNKVKYTIAANLDRTSPAKPTVTYKKSTDNSTYTPGVWTNSNIKSHVKGASSDVLAGWSRYEYAYTTPTGQKKNGTVSTADSDGYVIKDNGTTKIKYRSCDKANNCSAYTTEDSIKVDKVAPSNPSIVGYKKKSKTDVDSTSGLSSSGVASGEWVGAYLVLKASGSTDKNSTAGIESDCSGLKEYQSTATGSVNDKALKKGHLRNVNDKEGTSTITFKACDKAGNCSSGKNFVTKIDLTAPSLPTLTGYGCNASMAGCRAISANRWYAGHGKVTASSSIDTLSGGVYYVSEVDNSNVTTSSTKGADRVSPEGTHTVYFKACDKVHNCTATKSFIIKLDWTPPTCTSSGGNGTWTNGNRTLTGTCSDTGGSGCAGNVSTTYSTNINTTTASPGSVRDNAGNVTGCPANQAVRIDKTPPTCTAIAKYSNASGSNYSSGSKTCTNIYTSYSYGDAFGEFDRGVITTSGLTMNVTESNQYGSSWTVENASAGYSYLTWKVYDKAQNSATCSTITVNRGTYGASSACGCASYNYPCTLTRTVYTYKMRQAYNCQPASNQVANWHCGYSGSNTGSNMCCRIATTQSYIGTCTSNVCQQWNTCCY